MHLAKNNVVTINGISYNYAQNLTIYQFCFAQGLVLPCFCYHAKLSIAGNCRMCLVEANQALVVACATPLVQAISINTNSARLRHSREGILEFLLINHPLDCPICDQGGECDLQDITFTFGSDRGRFFGFKRALANLNCLGPLVKTVMTRCIHCTRCVRFLEEYGGTPLLGSLGRGASMEIGTYVEYIGFPEMELSANIIDLCPVGALTSMPYAFSSRPWELNSFESIDIFDALASSVRLDVVSNKVVRILPCLDESANTEWITNKARFVSDSLNAQRLNYPKYKYLGNYYIISWPRAINLFTNALFFNLYFSLGALVGPFLDLCSSLNLKNFFSSFGCSNVTYENNYFSCIDFRFQYLLNASLLSLELASTILFIGLNIRLESPLLNSRLRKNYFSSSGSSKFYSIGLAINYLTYPVLNLGNSVKTLFLLLEGKLTMSKKWLFTSFFNTSFLAITNPALKKALIFLGSSISLRKDANALITAISSLNRRISSSCCSISFVSDFLGRISSFDSGFLCTISPIKEPSFLFLMGVHSMKQQQLSKTSFVVFQGCFKNFLSYEPNLMLPSRSYAEQTVSFFNLQGRLRHSCAAITSFRLVFSDSEILHMLTIARRRFFKTNYSFLKNFYSIMSFFSSFIHYRNYFSNSSILFQRNLGLAEKKDQEQPVFLSFIFPNSYFSLKLLNSVFSKLVNNYYSSEVYSKNSKVMSLCASKIAFANFTKYV